jgi:hypothetical protein
MALCNIYLESFFIIGIFLVSNQFLQLKKTFETENIYKWHFIITNIGNNNFPSNVWGVVMIFFRSKIEWGELELNYFHQGGISK